MDVTDYNCALNSAKVGSCQETVLYLFSSLHQIQYFKFSRLAIFTYKLLKDSKVLQISFPVCATVSMDLSLSEVVSSWNILTEFGNIKLISTSTLKKSSNNLVFFYRIWSMSENTYSKFQGHMCIVSLKDSARVLRRCWTLPYSDLSILGQTLHLDHCHWSC